MPATCTSLLLAAFAMYACCCCLAKSVQLGGTGAPAGVTRLNISRISATANSCSDTRYVRVYVVHDVD